MKIKFHTLLICILAINLSITSTATANLSEAKFDFTTITDMKVGETIQLSGKNFGYDPQYVCFNSTETCVLALEWDDTSLQFTVPNNIPEKGTIFLSGIGKSRTVQYTLWPYIVGIFDSNGNEIDFAFSGETVSILAKGIGIKTITDNTKKVTFNDKEAKIVSWKDNLINLQIPELDKDTTEFTIWINGAQKETFQFIVKSKSSEDPYSYIQDYLKTIKWPEAKNKLDQTNQVIVAIIDDGIYTNHPDLENKIWENTDEILGNNKDDDNNGFTDDRFGYNFIDDNGEITPKGEHGTGVAGIIGATNDNQIGISGIATNVKLMPIIACNDQGCSDDAIKKGIRYATNNGAKVINISISGELTNTYTESFNETIKYAYDQGVVIVVSAGNGDPLGDIGYDLDQIPQSPVCNDNNQNMILGIGASTMDGNFRTNWSNFGKCVDLYAPGESIITLSISGEKYNAPDGTSFSAPIVSGFSAAILSNFPSMNNTTLYNYLINNSNNQVIETNKTIDAIKLTYNANSKQNDSKIQKSSLSSLNLFPDVKATTKNATAINFLRKNGIIIGYEDGTFKPDKDVSRAEMLKILIKGGLGLEPGAEYRKKCFNDINPSDWFANYVCYAKEKGWTEGYEDGTFQPNKTINKVEAIKFLVVINEIPKDDSAVLPYFDAINGAWYENYIKAAYSKGILEENGTILGVSSNMTRGSISENIFRIILIKELNETRYDDDLLPLIQTQ